MMSRTIVFVALMSQCSMENVDAFARTAIGLKSLRSSPLSSSVMDDTQSALLSVDISSASTPSMPDVSSIDFQSLDIPIDMTSISSMTDLPLPVVGAGVAVVLAAALAAAAGGSDDGAADSGSSAASSTSTAARKKKAKPPPQLEIPYDAASRLAYDTWCQAQETPASFNADAYGVYRQLYEAKAVADATSKRLDRDLAAFRNQPRPAVAPRKLIEKKAAEPSPPKEKMEARPYFVED